MVAQLIQLAASLIAVFAIYALVRWLGLGGDVRISSSDHAIEIARHDGFAGVAAVVDKAGYSALVRGADGRHLLIAKNGVHFITRMITPPIEGRLNQKFLTIDLPEPGFAPVTLNLGDAAQHWASGLRHIPRG